ncbi:hypothetical protein WG906_03075 [Pedobacter sp. P351]|uniref:tetratricopeptide repeat protein n=1 Tax=Pedobacter superstes TaxID=3133441 RepID=UPI0030A2F442
MRKSPFQNIIRRLFAVSGNECAFPDCKHVLIDEDGDFIGQVCHIQAAEKGGERYNPDQSDEDRRSFENLMLLCYAHHIKTDDVAKYPVETLKKIKSDHETTFQNSHYSLPLQHEEKILETIYDKLDKIHLITIESQDLIKEGNEINKDSNEKINQLMAIVSSSTFAVTTNDNKIHSEQLEFIKKFKKEGKYETALTSLLKFKEENWDKITNELKYKVLANIATILFDFGRKYDAANYLLELKTVSFESRERLSYLCLAYSILGEVEEFEKLFASTRIHAAEDINLWIAFIQARGQNTLPEDIVNEIPTTLLKVPEILVNLGEVFIDRGHIEKGFAFLDDAYEIINTDKEKVYLLGLIAEKKLVHVVTAEKMLFKSFSTDEFTLIERLATDLMKSWHNTAGTEKATGAYHFLMNAGICFKAIGRDKDAEIALFGAWTLSHQFICFKNLLFYYFDTIQYDKAKVLFDAERYIKIASTDKVELATCKARFFSLIREPQNAIKELTRVLESTKGEDRFLVLDLIVLTYFDCEDFEQALLYSKQLINEYPSRPEGYVSLGIYYSRSENQEEAKKFLDQAFEITHQLDQPSIILYLLGCEFASIQEHSKAAICFEQVVTKGIVNGPFKKLVLQYFYLEDYTRAEELAREGKKSVNDDALFNEVLFRCNVELERLTRQSCFYSNT